LEQGTADFRLIDRKIATILKKFKENDPFLRGLIKWIGFKQCSIQYKADDRFSGVSKYTLKKMSKLAFNGVMSFSIRPLYAVVYIGLAFSAMSILYIPYIIYAFYTGSEVHGWASVIMTIVFFGGIQLSVLGIIGIYIGKLFIQAKERPNYIISSTNIQFVSGNDLVKL
ncbi:MAG: glycosyltransferase, partial [Chitinophagaceae bacterium]